MFTSDTTSSLLCSSFNALTLLVWSLTCKNLSPIWPMMCLVGRYILLCLSVYCRVL